MGALEKNRDDSSAQDGGAWTAAGAAAAGPPVGSFPAQTPKHAKVLYNQNNDNAGVSVFSDNFGTYYNQGADDFVVPAHAVWTITEVDVTGQYFDGSGPATSEAVIFYADDNGMPGDAVATFSTLKGTENNGAFSITLPGKGIKLEKGRYWVSVTVTPNFAQGGGEWGWYVNSVLHGDEAMWQSPGQQPCPTWGTLEACTDTGPDLMFALKGTKKHA